MLMLPSMNHHESIPPIPFESLDSWIPEVRDPGNLASPWGGGLESLPRPWPLWLKLRLSFLVPTHPHQGFAAAKVLRLKVSSKEQRAQRRLLKDESCD